MDALKKAQMQAQFDIARAGLPQEYYSPEMSMAAQPNMSAVNPMQQPQAGYDFSGLANYGGLAPIEHQIAQIQRGGGMVQPLPVPINYGVGMSGYNDKKDSSSGLLEMIMKMAAKGA